MSLEGKVALVTGGSRGIGRAIALRLAADGADIALCARSVEPAEAVGREVEALGRRCLVRQADVSQSDQAEELIGAVVDELGSLYALINNAGITRDNLLMRMKEEDWDAVMQVNLKGAFNCARAAVRPWPESHAARRHRVRYPLNRLPAGRRLLRQCARPARCRPRPAGRPVEIGRAHV